jgi:hypothetical protein
VSPTILNFTAPSNPKGDYDRQLAKMRVAHARKRALIETLLDAAARHAVLRGVQSGELNWLRALQSAVDGARGLLGASAAAAERREAACAALAAAAAAAQQRSSVAPEDAYLTRLQRLLRPAGADWAAVAAGGEGWQQGGAGAGAGGLAGGGQAGTPQAPLLTPRRCKTVRLSVLLVQGAPEPDAPTTPDAVGGQKEPAHLHRLLEPAPSI